jgi:hypothetical protein
MITSDMGFRWEDRNEKKSREIEKKKEKGRS